MISSALASRVGIRRAAAAPTTSSLRTRAAALGIVPVGNLRVVKEEIDQGGDGAMPGEEAMLGALDQGSSTGETAGVGPGQPSGPWFSAPGPWEGAAGAVPEADPSAASQPPWMPRVVPPPKRRPVPSGKRLLTVQPTSAPPARSGPRATNPYVDDDPPPLQPPAGAGTGSSSGPKPWELDRERRYAQARTRDVACKAICAVKHGLRQPGAQSDGMAFVPADWDQLFRPALGSYIQFLLSRPDQFRIVEGATTGLYTIENVATAETVVAPAWRNRYRIRVKGEAAGGVKMEGPPATDAGGDRQGRPAGDGGPAHPRPQAEGGPDSDICWHFQRGFCRNGQQCKWAHRSAGSGVKAEAAGGGPGEDGARRSWGGLFDDDGNLRQRIDVLNVPADPPERPQWAANLSRALPPLRPVRVVHSLGDVKVEEGTDPAKDAREGPPAGEGLPDVEALPFVLDGGQLDTAARDAEEGQAEEELADVEALPFVVEGELGAVPDMEEPRSVRAARTEHGINVWSLLGADAQGAQGRRRGPSPGAAAGGAAKRARGPAEGLWR